MQIGDTYEVKKTVTEQMTAATVGSGALNVFGTPYLVAMMEEAALTYMQGFLSEGKSTVGTQINIAHVSPTPVGMEVRAIAEVAAISENGKIVDFKVTAYDEAGLIAEGTHQRAIISTERFLSKCRGKLSKEN